MDRFERAGQAFAELCRVMARLRAPGGCPWDREQTLASLRTYLLEETHETLEAMDRGDPKAHREELGDLLLQIVFQTEITAEAGQFDVADVADAIRAKLVRRHPHVFGDAKAESASGALANWEAVKAKERDATKSSVLDGVPRAMPALLRAFRTGEKAAAVGFDWADMTGARAKVEEEWRELTEHLAPTLDAAKASEELGDLLFALTSLGRHLAVNPEDALRATIDKFHRRFRHVETQLATRGRTPKDSTLEEMDALWDEAKALEK